MMLHGGTRVQLSLRRFGASELVVRIEEWAGLSERRKIPGMP